MRTRGKRKREDLMRRIERINGLEIKYVDLIIIRFMINDKHDSDVKDKIEILPNKYDRIISFK